jgi:hypothetical protein
VPAPPADKDQHACDVKQIKQDCRRNPDLAQHVADLRGEEASCDDAEKQEIQRYQGNQRRKIEHKVPVLLNLQPAAAGSNLAHHIDITSRGHWWFHARPVVPPHSRDQAARTPSINFSTSALR